jgi:hypothetical protein
MPAICRGPNASRVPLDQRDNPRQIGLAWRKKGTGLIQSPSARDAGNPPAIRSVMFCNKAENQRFQSNWILHSHRCTSRLLVTAPPL